MTFSACETTENESAKIEREAVIARENEPGALKLGAANRAVRASQVTLLSGGGRNAVAMRLTSSSTRAQANVPVLVNVTGKAGKLLYSNQPGGTEPLLQHVGLLGPHASAWWVNDQVLVNQPSTGVKVRVGAGRRPSGRLASSALEVRTTHLSARSGVSTVGGVLVNRAGGREGQVPVFAVGLRGGKVVAAGRVLVASLAGRRGAAAHFQFPLVGNAAGAEIELTAMPSTGA
ncbi:MAG TPA: hypothetical protein VHW67_07385 [Solirubrobacteraceae bacterium]|nr:hypothetical protein [Solirubrobacteraceae bacterium]